MKTKINEMQRDALVLSISFTGGAVCDDIMRI
jgi:hypothetical protein